MPFLNIQEQRNKVEENIVENVEQVLQPRCFSDLDLPPEVLEKLSQSNFIELLPVQAAAIPPALEGKDLLIQAQTGSGKTLAYLLPLLTKLHRDRGSISFTSPYALILVPTRELAQQVTSVLSLVSLDVHPVALIGGVPIKEQRRELDQDARIIVGTPGRLLDCLRQRIISLKSCRFCVLDEVDEMFSMGFFEDVRAILARLPAKRQGLFVSATISPRVTMVAQSFLNKPENIFVDRAGKDMPPIKHYQCKVGSGATDKPEALCDLIETRRPRSCIIFCNTKSDTELVEVFLRRRGYDARRLNSDLSQKQREQIMDRIRSQDLRFLVATDIAARGLDIEQIELVINFALHEEPEMYVHRTGRTGRAGRCGMALSLVGPQDFLAFHKVSKTLEVNIQELPLPTDEEVSEARLAHLYELIKVNESALTARDLLVARKFIKEVFGVEDPEDETVEMVGKLQRSFVLQSLEAETSSLEEELASGAKQSTPRPSRGGRRKGGGGRSGGRSGRSRSRK
ncbi:MAG: DEAD/DEAH box helicase [Deltaproteobacteria bacterium]|nr:DEAD/DEAH box helicase [Deltaproteobacteria bacterium]